MMKKLQIARKNQIRKESGNAKIYGNANNLLREIDIYPVTFFYFAG